jgi:hypothetical protein
MISIETVDKTHKKSYKSIILEFVKINFDDASKIVICFECRNVLRKIVSFLEVVVKNNEWRLVGQDGGSNDQPSLLPDEPSLDSPVKQIIAKANQASKEQAKEQAEKDEATEQIATAEPVEPPESIEDKTLDHIEEDEIPEEEESIPTPKPKPEKKSLLCADCGKVFANSQRLKIHSFTHSNIKDFKCTEELENGVICDKAFATEFRLKTHQRIHFGLKPYKCKFPGCGAAFAQGNALTNHSRLVSVWAFTLMGFLDWNPT